jgi:hypothetical protein
MNRPFTKMTSFFIYWLDFLRLVFFARLAALREKELSLFLDFAYGLGIIYATDLLEEDG